MKSIKINLDRWVEEDYRRLELRFSREIIEGFEGLVMPAEYFYSALLEKWAYYIMSN